MPCFRTSTLDRGRVSPMSLVSATLIPVPLLVQLLHREIVRVSMEETHLSLQTQSPPQWLWVLSRVLIPLQRPIWLSSVSQLAQAIPPERGISLLERVQAPRHLQLATTSSILVVVLVSLAMR